MQEIAILEEISGDPDSEVSRTAMLALADLVRS
jgi:hypothetical protein